MLPNIFKDNEESRDEYLKLQGYFYGWTELIKYYISFGCTKKGKDIFNKFQELNINYNKSYAVVGNKHLLRAFAAYYLRTLGTVRRGFVKHNMKDYAFQYDSEQKFAEDDVMFLLSPKYDNYYGNTMRTLEANIMYTVCRRADDNQVTILLMESPIEELLNKDELQVIDLYKQFHVKNKPITINKESDIECDYESVLLRKYPDLVEVDKNELLPNKKYMAQGDYETAYENIKKVRGMRK